MRSRDFRSVFLLICSDFVGFLKKLVFNISVREINDKMADGDFTRRIFFVSFCCLFNFFVD